LANISPPPAREAGDVSILNVSIVIDPMTIGGSGAGSGDGESVSSVIRPFRNAALSSSIPSR
jgi:hypothetical protein